MGEKALGPVLWSCSESRRILTAPHSEYLCIFCIRCFSFRWNSRLHSLSGLPSSVTNIATRIVIRYVKSERKGGSESLTRVGRYTGDLMKGFHAVAKTKEGRAEQLAHTDTDGESRAKQCAFLLDKLVVLWSEWL